MASFIAKQVVGKKLESVKDALVDKDEKSDKKSEDSEQDPIELEEARKEAEERRKDKYRKMEEEREKMRQDIRDKYGIKKKDNIAASSDCMTSEMDQRRPNANGSSCVPTDAATADDPGECEHEPFNESLRSIRSSAPY